MNNDGYDDVIVGAYGYSSNTGQAYVYFGGSSMDNGADVIMTGGGPLWSTETVSTYVYKRAFDWNTFDLGYPSAIAVLWSLIILLFVALMTRLLGQRDKLEF